MCLAIVAINRSAELPLVMIGNRDEYHERATAGLHWWDDHPALIAGRDLVAKGTWFGASANGKYGLVTNFRESPGAPPRHSRGQLLTEFLNGTSSPREFADEIALGDYAGFNLIIGARDAETLYVSNRAEPVWRVLGDGVHAVSNALLDTPWPKLVRVRDAVTHWLDDPRHDTETLFQPLRDMTQSAEPDTPDLNIEPAINRALTAPFIVGENYGTRSTSLLTMDAAGSCRFLERRFDRAGDSTGDSEATFQLRE